MTSKLDRVRLLEEKRDLVIETLLEKGKASVLTMDASTLGVLNSLLNSGVNTELSLEKLQLAKNQQEVDGDYKKQATALIQAKREEANRRALEVSERENTNQSRRDTLPEIPTRDLLPNEGSIGQFQLDYDVLSGSRPFKEDECILRPDLEEPDPN